MTQLEKDIEKKLRLMVERHGGLCLKWVCPGWSGVPDRIILLPGGHILFAETKRPKGGKVEKLQQWWRKKLNGLGFKAYIVWSEEDVEALDWVIKTSLAKDPNDPCISCKHLRAPIREEPCWNCNGGDKWELSET